MDCSVSCMDIHDNLSLKIEIMKDKILKEYIDLALENDEIASIEVTGWQGMGTGVKPIFKLVKRDPVFVPVQLCPKCHGDGMMAYTYEGMNSSVLSGMKNCNICNGNKTIPMIKS